MSLHDQLAHELRLRFGTSGYEPDSDQLDQIIDEVRKLRAPTDSDWRRAVERYCPTAGQHKYASRDLSDLNSILDQLLGPRR